MNLHVIEQFNSVNYNENIFENQRMRKLSERYLRLKERLLFFINDNQEQFTYFTWFYGMNHCSRDYRTAFYNTIREYYINGIPEGTTVTSLAASLQEYGHFEFVFASKMLNLLNESEYPIVDSKISRLFEFEGSYSENGEELIQDIKETYDYIASHDERNIIQKFRDVFHFENIGIYRVIDLILFSQLN